MEHLSTPTIDGLNWRRRVLDLVDQIYSVASGLPHRVSLKHGVRHQPHLGRSKHPSGDWLETSNWRERAMANPAWTMAAQRAARSLDAKTGRKPGAVHSVYVILLRNAKRRDPWGLYVGQTSCDPDLRFDQHRSGYRASSAVRRFGIRLLPELVAHLNPMSREESLELEATLADAFRAAGVSWVEGGH